MLLMLLLPLTAFINYTVLRHKSGIMSKQNHKKGKMLQVARNILFLSVFYFPLCDQQKPRLSLHWYIFVYFSISCCLWIVHGDSLSSIQFLFVHSPPLPPLPPPLLPLQPCILWKIKPCKAPLWCAKAAWCLVVMDTNECSTVASVVLEFNSGLLTRRMDLLFWYFKNSGLTSAIRGRRTHLNMDKLILRQRLVSDWYCWRDQYVCIYDVLFSSNRV